MDKNTETKNKQQRRHRKTPPQHLGTKSARPKLEFSLAGDINGNKKQIHKNYRSKKKLRKNQSVLMNTGDSLEVCIGKTEVLKTSFPQASTNTAPKPLQAGTVRKKSSKECEEK